MAADSNFGAALSAEGDLTDAQYLVCGQFESIMDTCYDGWSSGKHTVVLPADLQEMLGDFGLQYFERSLAERVGGRVTFTIVRTDTGVHTHVRMPATMMHQLALPHTLVPQVDFSEVTATDINVTDTAVKKTPRPMNCWIIFRNAMRKIIKFDDPNLSVQEISTKCSKLWKGFSKERKEPWVKAAELAKEEHLRQYPDYRYTPRKPGQKKKRQSQKTKLAALDAASTNVFHLQVVFNNDMQSVDTSAPPTIATGPVAVDAGNQVNDAAAVNTDNVANNDTSVNADNIAANGTPVSFGHIGTNGTRTNAVVANGTRTNAVVANGTRTNTFVANGTPLQLVGNGTSLQLVRRVPSVERRHAEVFRQARLEAEFGSGTSVADPSGEGAFAFPVVGPSATPEKAKKGLNGFVGFRCYYINCPMFKEYPMAKLSGATGKMWDADPNHSVWNLVAEAWSTIRDQIGKSNAPLDHYLNIICPSVNLPSPEIYLELQGWSVTVNDKGEVMVDRDCLAQSPSISARCAGLSLSVEDIINHCQQFGYALQFDHDKNATSTTFLAHSHQQDDDHEARIRAKKQRRAIRLAKPALELALKKEIAELHGLDFDDDEMPIEEDREPTLPPFFSQPAGMLTNNPNNIPTNNMTGTTTNNNAAVNNMAGNTAVQHAMVNNMGGSMINNNAVLPDVPTKNPDEPESGYEQTDSEDDQMDLEGGENDIQTASKDMTNGKAFRDGADGNVTLPPFDERSLLG